MPRYTPEEFWILYAKLPQELKDAVNAEETGDAINTACTQNNIPEKLPEIVELVGAVLIGLLPPQEFQEALTDEVGLEEDVARKVFHEINRFVFSPVKDILAGIYEAEEIGEEARANGKKTPLSKKISEIRKGPDTYREQIEE